VHAARDSGPYGRRRDEAVADALSEGGRRLVLTGSPYAVDPGSVRKADGRPYAVFTPFSRAWRAAGAESPDDSPRPLWSHRLEPGALPAAPIVDAELPAAGEAVAHAQLDRFRAGPIDHYDATRDLPAVDGTSRLSPYLRWGCLHPRQVLAGLGRRRAHVVFGTELAWREFYADVLLHQPRAAWWNLDRRMDAMAVDTGAAARSRLARWADGRTGYPFVDAGLRQLLATGWMHNRVRMVVGSFLVKDLHLPWQWGARHFLRHLVDGDLASNNLSWQWVAGTGTDAAPYFRVFNPVSQSKRFDPDGDYIRRWVPEVAGLDATSIHEPWTAAGGRPDGYPRPMIDHAEEREEALRRYASLPRR
jgi:deoxyribodipyrimidine photo-lyase